MNFEFSEEQNLLREQARGFLKDNCPMSKVRAVLDGATDYDADLWRKVAEMGWTAAVVPEEYGGLGLGYLELVVIAEEIGRAVAPIPFSSSVYLATESLLLAGSTVQKEAWLPKLATGEVIGTFASAEGQGRVSPTTLTCTVTNGKLSGTKVPVMDGSIANIATVLAKSGKGPGLYLVDLNQKSVKRESVNTIDPTRGQARLTFDGADAQLLGDEGNGWALHERLLNRAAVLYAWEQVGGAEAALEQAKEYALGRFAFGRPIASYQAIKHKLANMYVKNTLAKSNCYFGAWALNTDADELALAAATARVSAIQAYYFASKENIQTHGGMGYTWEFDCQFFYRRSKVLSVLIGSEAQWQDKLVDAALAQQTSDAA
ncbi:MAG: acyl-CoA/acyl-ACP dehydrogenase [Proteobacteria bacterium]|nr:acyl-CoA/acyl-ACP dehydrogenase [Pseudomonadota bacterium]